ncbi:MAG: hypothetical protein MJ215_03985 [Spirochaetia bacterium]|nr:hypothetical protein [Spirochaetia bacterium]
MKKFIAILFLTLVCIVGVSAGTADKYPYAKLEKAPELDVKGAVIFDIRDLQKKIEDNVAIINLTKMDSFMCDIYYVDGVTGEWSKNKFSAALKGYGDRDITEFPKGVKIKYMPYIAIRIDHTGNFDFNVYASHNDVYIEVSSQDESFEKITD